MAKASHGMAFNITDGMIEWYNGPEWDEVAEQEFDTAASDIEESAKRDAPWADRTGDARDGLTATVYNDKGLVGVVLYHTVEYGKWLELIQNGRFAIIRPTLEAHAHRLTYNAIRRIRYARRGRVV